MIAYWLPNMQFRLPWALDCAFMAILFYGLGWIAKKVGLVQTIKIIQEHKVVSVMGITILAILLLPLVSINGEVNMRTITYGNYFLYIFNATIYSFLLIAISMIIEKMVGGKILGNILEWIGRNTLVVLLLNSTCIRAYEVICGGVLNELSDSVIYGINAIVAILIVVICVVISEFINRFCPWIIGKTKRK